MTQTPPSDLSGIIHHPAPVHPPGRLRSWLIGRPLPTADAPHQAISKKVGLAVFASDALSSTAYATQEILIVLAVAGTAVFVYALPISLAIVVLLAVVTFSYEQTIHAYPSGGGAYIVSRDNLGTLPAQVAGAALLTDYILTVAVSMSAGTAQIVSAFPALTPYKVIITVGLVLLVMLINLRGVKESGFVFSIPTYFFIFMITLMLITGIVRYLGGNLGTVSVPPELEILTTQSMTLFLVLHAFSSGTTALTGVEAISNGVPAFKEPRSRNAGITLIWMATILGIFFLAITFLVNQVEAIPSESETVISQLARTIFAGQELAYLAVITATTLILIMAANPAFAGFPRLSALQASDRYLPRHFTYRGSRLVYSWGIVILSLVACFLIVIFQARVTSLIPLYAIGVFLSFTLSQTGMALRWRKIGRLGPEDEVQEKGSVLRFDPGWRWKMVLNGFGALCTFVVMLVFAVTKFRDGAWVVLILIPTLVTIFLIINRHYRNIAEALSISGLTKLSDVKSQRAVLLLSGVHKGTLAALGYARALSSDVHAVFVSTDESENEKIQTRWAKWGEGVPLVIIDSPYRELMHPLVSYIDELASELKADEVLTIVVPQFVPRRWWENLLHMQTATWLRWALLHREGVVVVDVPYQLE